MRKSSGGTRAPGQRRGGEVGRVTLQGYQLSTSSQQEQMAAVTSCKPINHNAVNWSQPANPPVPLGEVKRYTPVITLTSAGDSYTAAWFGCTANETRSFTTCAFFLPMFSGSQTRWESCCFILYAKTHEDFKCNFRGNYVNSWRIKTILATNMF